MAVCVADDDVLRPMRGRLTYRCAPGAARNLSRCLSDDRGAETLTRDVPGMAVRVAATTEVKAALRSARSMAK